MTQSTGRASTGDWTNWSGTAEAAGTDRVRPHQANRDSNAGGPSAYQFRILQINLHRNGFRLETTARQSSARAESAVCGTPGRVARWGSRGRAAALAVGLGVDQPRSWSRSWRAMHRGRSAAPARRRG
jgi:hypothetical protein